jgi:probable rRNA maturation factor
LEYPEAELSVVLVDDAEISLLNRQYLGHEGPTNVISFPMQEGEFTDINPNLLGDVVISVETANREAGEADISMDTRLLELLIHGILHLVGYDHEAPDADAPAMESKTEELLGKYGHLVSGG